MATRVELSAFPSHEARVAAFLASVPTRRRERVEAKFDVLDEGAERLVQAQESSWDPALLDAIEATDLPLHRSLLRGHPSFPDPD